MKCGCGKLGLKASCCQVVIMTPRALHAAPTALLVVLHCGSVATDGIGGLLEPQ